jgi:hypothetical protein
MTRYRSQLFFFVQVWGEGEHTETSGSLLIFVFIKRTDALPHLCLFWLAVGHTAEFKIYVLLHRPRNESLLTFMGPYIVNIFQYISNKMQLYTAYSYLETALYFSGGTFTHHQERIHLHLQHLVFVRPLLLPAAIAASSSNGLTNTRCCRYSCMRSC